MAEQGSLLPLRLAGVGYSVQGRALLSDIELELRGGSRTVILGHNGAGKSLLMRICHGLVAPTTGVVQWATPERKGRPRRQAMVFQRPVMLRRSAAANVAYALALAGIPAGERRSRAASALARVGLTQVAQRPARVLSGGEQQRLALARAWALEPKVLFLDEPTSSLDPGAAREVEAIVIAIGDAGTKIVMSTHNLAQARRLGDEILFMYQGRLLERASADVFFRQPATAEAAAFIEGELPWT